MPITRMIVAALAVTLFAFAARDRISQSGGGSAAMMRRYQQLQHVQQMQSVEQQILRIDAERKLRRRRAAAETADEIEGCKSEASPMSDASPMPIGSSAISPSIGRMSSNDSSCVENEASVRRGVVHADASSEQ